MCKLMKNATKIGEMTNCSAQEINKRLRASGLMYKSSDGYHLTEAGKYYGTEMIKLTKTNYMCRILEWNEAVISVIFNREERKEIAKWRMLQRKTRI